MGRREQRERERKRAATSCKSIESVVKKSCSAQGQPSPSDTSSTTSVRDSVQSSLVQTSTTGCATSDIQASPTRSPVSSVSLTESFISTGSQIHSSTEPCSSSSVHSAMIQSPASYFQ